VRSIFALGALASAVAAFVSTGPASATSACGRSGYSYAGLQAARPAHGVRADLVALGAPYVQSGHVAAWVGVGGPGQGKGGSDAWIQVGLSAFQGTGSRLYMEVNGPGIGPRYTEIRTYVAPGARYRVAVREVRHRPNTWAVWVNGHRVSQPVFLAGSHGRWRPIATAETWDGGQRVCNLFAYRFNHVLVVDSKRTWRRFQRGYRFQDPGYRLVSSRGGFVARANRALPKATAAARRQPAPPAPSATESPAPEPAPSVQDPNGSTGPDVALENQDAAVGDSDAPVGDGLSEEVGSTGPVDSDDPAPGPLTEP
jgi:hypothetical protein